MSGSGGATGVISQALARGLLNHAFMVQVMPQPLGLFVGLFTSTVGAGVEVPAGGGTSYFRQGIAGFTAAGGTPVVVTNTADIIWAPMGMTAWGTIVAGGIFDVPNGPGNFYGWANLVAPDGVTVIEVPMTTPGAIFRIPTGQLVVGIT